MWAGQSFSDHPFWDILKEFGGEERRNSQRAIEEFIRYTKASLYHYRFSDRARRYNEEFEDNLASFDLEDIYEAMPYRLEEGRWRGSGHIGVYRKGKIFVDLQDPEIGVWLRLPERFYRAPWREVYRLGDFDRRYYIRPLPQEDGGLHYEAYYLTRMGLGRLAPNFILRALLALQRYMEYGVVNVPSDFRPSEGMRRRFPKLSRGELYVMERFRRDMPGLYQKIVRYVEVKGFSIPLRYKGLSYCRFNLHLALKLGAIRRDFPAMYRYLYRLKGFLQLKSRMYNGGNFVGFLSFSTTNFELHFSFCMKGGRFLTCKYPWVPLDHRGFSPLDRGKQRYTFRNDIALTMKKVRVVLRDLILEEEYEHTPEESTLVLRMRKPPRVEKIEGSAYGVIPIWLIDLLIPSNVEDLLKDFFAVLANGLDGKGWLIYFRGVRSKRGNRLESSLAAEMLSNGIIQLGLNIASNLLIPGKAARRDFNRFGKIFWHGFVSSYFRWKFDIWGSDGGR
ncbi:MAG: hypothetical protein D6805_04360 [Planctomycetota bacterium]|nr:MAG: hypothetical protein D6805_04360 [Planctomycetota bacterium]